MKYSRMHPRLNKDFYQKDAHEVAPKLLGKTIVKSNQNGTKVNYLISDVEVYYGEEDLACHASKGRTQRTEIMYHSGGYIYMYLIYGIHWMFNIVTGRIDHPQAILIRGVNNISGPGKLTKELGLNKNYYAEDLSTSSRIWIENATDIEAYHTAKRVGIDYAGEYWKNKLWRYYIDSI